MTNPQTNLAELLNLPQGQLDKPDDNTPNYISDTDIGVPRITPEIVRRICDYNKE